MAMLIFFLLLLFQENPYLGSIHKKLKSSVNYYNKSLLNDKRKKKSSILYGD